MDRPALGDANLGVKVGKLREDAVAPRTLCLAQDARSVGELDPAHRLGLFLSLLV